MRCIVFGLCTVGCPGTLRAGTLVVCEGHSVASVDAEEQRVQIHGVHAGERHPIGQAVIVRVPQCRARVEIERVVVAQRLHVLRGRSNLVLQIAPELASPDNLGCQSPAMVAAGPRPEGGHCIRGVWPEGHALRRALHSHQLDAVVPANQWQHVLAEAPHRPRIRVEDEENVVGGRIFGRLVDQVFQLHSVIAGLIRAEHAAICPTVLVRCVHGRAVLRRERWPIAREALPRVRHILPLAVVHGCVQSEGQVDVKR
mmetsp:Transcript_18659/g.44310  ORF Transcript_18659/g.44310 Transcript_18659/m.44310 type:complete len:256 (-) Transcript_18659:2073-2840(-)|eukprot:scaffold34763_cov82-Phaeocystis_antarctica.AAC.8